MMDEIGHYAGTSRPVWPAPDPPPRHRRGIALAGSRAMSLAAFVLLWWIGADLAADPQMLPPPGRVLAFTWRELRNFGLPLNIAISLARVAAAFAIAMLIGSCAGYLAGRRRRLDAVIDPWMVIALNLPVLVVVVLSYIWLGLNEVAAVLAVAIAKTPTVFITVREGARALDPGLRDLEHVYRLTLWRRLWWVTMPQLLPYLAAAARSGLSITWKIVLVVELLGRPNGVGFILNLYFQSFNVTGILTYGLSFAAIMLVVEATLLRPWERRANAWRTRA
jgi:NitT/TauT family transport system permease protein